MFGVASFGRVDFGRALFGGVASIRTATFRGMASFRGRGDI